MSENKAFKLAVCADTVRKSVSAWQILLPSNTNAITLILWGFCILYMLKYAQISINPWKIGTRVEDGSFKKITLSRKK